MKKRVLVLIALMAVLLLVAGPAYAKPPIAASGTWCYTPSIAGIPRLAGGNTFLEATSVGRWEGTFVGVSSSVYAVVMHEVVSPTVTGSWNAQGLVTFVGTVGDKSGTLVMRFLGSRPDASAEWEGKWVILRGTDELVNLRGQGTWWGLGAPAPEQEGCVWYSGKIHFEPQ